MSPPKRRQRTGGAWLWLIFVTCVIAGGIIGPMDRPTRAERIQQERCEPTAWRADSDREAWDLLIAQGYVEQTGPHVLSPPGCEGVR